MRAKHITQQSKVHFDASLNQTKMHSVVSTIISKEISPTISYSESEVDEDDFVVVSNKKSARRLPQLREK